MRKILQGELGAAENLNRHRFCVAENLSGRRCSVLHKFIVCLVELKHAAKLQKSPQITKENEE